MTRYLVATWGDSARLGVLTEADFRAPQPEPLPDIAFVGEPGAELADTLPYVLGASPALAPGSDRATRGELYVPKNTAPESETWRWDRAVGWITHAWDQSRRPGDPGWFWWPDDRWIPLQATHGDVYDVQTTLYDRRALDAPADLPGSYTTRPWTAQIRIEVGHGRYAGHDVRLVVWRDNREGPRPAPKRGRFGRQERFFFSLTGGWVRFESWKDNDQTGVPEIESAVNGPTRQAAFEPCPRPVWAPAWTPRDPDPIPEPEPMPTPVYVAPPRDQILAVIAWLRGEVYPGLVGHPLDDEGIAAWVCDRYCALRAHGVGHEDARHRIYADIESVVRPRRPVDPPPPAGDAPVIRVDGRVFRNVDGTLHDWREASAFMLLWLIDRGSARAVIDGWRARGMNRLRVLGMVGTDFWRSRGFNLRPSDPHYDDALDDLCSLAREGGMALRFTLFADAQVCCPSRAERRLFARRVGDVLRDHPHVVAEIANEPSINGFGDDVTELAELAAILKEASPQTLVALGAEHGSRGHYATMAIPPADYVTFHAERRTEESGHAWPRRLSEYAVLLSPDEKDGQDGEREWRAFFPDGWRAMPAVSGEPINAGSEGAPGDWQTDPAIWFAYGALSRIVPTSGYAPCLHLHRGLWAELPGDEATEACVRAFHAGCDAVPLACVSGQWVNGHWAESPFRGFNQTNPPSDDRPSRIFGRIVDGEYWGVAVRAPHGWAYAARDLRYPVRKVAEQRGERFDCQVWVGRVS